MNKLILLFVGVLMFTSFISASADVAYIVVTDSHIKQDFIDLIEDVSLTYEIVHSSEVALTDFNEYRLILLNDDYFSNWAEIPINDFPALMVNGRHIDNWGWTRRITIAAQDEPIHVDLNTTHEIKGSLLYNVPVYNSVEPDIYYLDAGDIYDGLEIIASNIYDNDDAVIAIAHEGTNLTRGSSVTEINANGVFFGIKENNYWTDETKELFKNSLLWLAGDTPQEIEEFEISLKEGYNLISIPLELFSNNVVDIMSLNPEVISVEEYVDGNFVEVTEMYNNKGYFVKCSADSVLELQGYEITETQNILLEEGMNLIGISSLLNMDLDSLPLEVVEVAKRTEDGIYDISTYYNTEWFNEFALEPGVGYWFKLNAEVIWNYSP